MDNFLARSRKKTASALSIFDKAVQELVKANKILEDGVKEKNDKYDAMVYAIKAMESEMDELSAGSIELQSEIKDNVKLMAKFTEFTGGK